MDLAAASAAIDAANAEDPNVVPDPARDGELRPKELVHAEHMTRWVTRLDPDADDAQLLAARAHHFRRWTSPRADYPEGRAGYLRWRKDARARHVAEVDSLLTAHGADDALRRDVAAIIGKENVRTDPRCQTHEDALCLVFFELQGRDTAAQLGDRALDVVRKTLAKMSPAGRAALDATDLDPGVRAAVAAVTAGPAEADDADEAQPT